MKRTQKISLTALLALGAHGMALSQTVSPATERPQELTQTQLLAPLNGQKPLRTSPGAKELAAIIRDRPLTIDDAVQIALATSRNFASSLANLDEVHARTSLAKTQLNPHLEANAQLTQYGKEVAASFGGTSLVLTNAFNPIYVAAVTLPIDIVGAIHSAVSQAEYREVAARIDVNRVRNETVFAVRNAFYGALRAQGQLVVAQDSLANAESRLHDAQSILRVGIGTKFDLLTAQRDVADAQQGVLNARGQVTLALAQLKNVMGIDISMPIKIVDSGAIEDPTGAAPEVTSGEPTAAGTKPRTAEASERFHVAQNEVDLGPEYDAAVQEALGARPEVLESEAIVSAAKQGINYARRSSLPSLSLSANYVVQPNNAGFTPEHQASITLGLVVPIYDGGVASANVREAKAEVASAEVQRRGAVDQVTLEVQQAYVTLVQARQRVQVANIGLTQAVEAFRMARLRANAGVTATPQASPELELSNAQTTLTQAETNRVTALYDYNIARSQLQRAIGRYSYGTGAGYSKVPNRKVTGN